jgi:hypothetical protein
LVECELAERRLVVSETLDVKRTPKDPTGKAWSTIDVLLLIVAIFIIEAGVFLAW